MKVSGILKVTGFITVTAFSVIGAKKVYSDYMDKHPETKEKITSKVSGWKNGIFKKDKDSTSK